MPVAWFARRHNVRTPQGVRSRSSRFLYSRGRLGRLGGRCIGDRWGAGRQLIVADAVGVAGDAAALVGAELVLVDDPVQGAAVAEAVAIGCGWDARAAYGAIKPFSTDMSRCNSRLLHELYDQRGSGNSGTHPQLHQCVGRRTLGAASFA